MKIYYIVLFLLFPFGVQAEIAKKKILIFSGHGGGGHVSASTAIKSYLDPEKYTVNVAFMFDEVLRESDLVSRATKGKISGDDLYNMLMKKKLHTVLNKIYDVGVLTFKLQEPTIEKILFAYLEKMQPDLIISVIPLVNNAILQTATVLNIPFLLIPTDLDPGMALNAIKKPTYDRFRVGLSYDVEAINGKVISHFIPRSKISYVGFPVKKCFVDKQFCQSIENEFPIPKDKPVVLVLMGSQGSVELYKYAKELAKVKVPLHLIFAVGRSEGLKEKINTIKFPSHITYMVVGFTDKMPEIMQKANLFISKSGGVSVNEGIYANLPMLLDASTILLRWEKFNLNFVVQQGFGQVVKHISHLLFEPLSSKINKLFEDQTKLQEYKRNLEAFAKPNPSKEIPALVAQMVGV